MKFGIGIVGIWDVVVLIVMIFLMWWILLVGMCLRVVSFLVFNLINFESFICFIMRGMGVIIEVYIGVIFGLCEWLIRLFWMCSVMKIRFFVVKDGCYGVLDCFEIVF